MTEQMNALVLLQTPGNEWKPGPKTWHPVEVKSVPVPTATAGTWAVCCVAVHTHTR